MWPVPALALAPGGAPEQERVGAPEEREGARLTARSRGLRPVDLMERAPAPVLERRVPAREPVRVAAREVRWG